jgi:hypothetical protein
MFPTLFFTVSVFPTLFFTVSILPTLFFTVPSFHLCASCFHLPYFVLHGFHLSNFVLHSFHLSNLTCSARLSHNTFAKGIWHPGRASPLPFLPCELWYFRPEGLSRGRSPRKVTKERKEGRKEVRPRKGRQFLPVEVPCGSASCCSRQQECVPDRPRGGDVRRNLPSERG